MSFNDLMVDLETTDIVPTSKVLSIGLVYFDRDTGELGERYYNKFSPTEGLNSKRSESIDTLEWWDKQDPKLRKEAFSGTMLLEDFLRVDLPDTYQPKTRVWGNGATFDVSILEDALRQADLPVPWKFWDIRDVRTVRDLASGIVGVTKAKVAHDPISDCENQIGYICKMIKALRN